MSQGATVREPEIDFDERKVDALLAGLNQCHLPGAAVGIAIGSAPVYRKGFGMASMELPVVLSSATRLRILSITKHFAALAYLLLCEEGNAGLDDAIVEHLPELHPIAHRVTMRQLMGNISGLRDVHGICWQLSGVKSAASSADLLALYREIDDVNFAPGTAYSYNNGGWLLLSAAIERIAGGTLEEVMRERLFEPIGMRDTLLRRFDTDCVPNSATTHMVNPAGGFEKFHVGSASAGEGGIVSTVDDMLRWLAHMDEPCVGSSETWDAIRTPQTLANGVSTGYGLGLSTGTYRGVRTLSHPGGWWGGNAYMLKVPAAGLDIVVMVNRHDVASTLLVKQILDVCLTGLEPVKDAVTGPFATGTFRSSKTGKVIRLHERDGQQMALFDGMEMMLERQDDRILRPQGVMGFLRQSLSLSGDPEHPQSLRFDDFGTLDELVAVGVPEDPELHSIRGRYRSDSTRTSITIDGSAETPKLRSEGRFGSVEYVLECIGEGLWQARSTTPDAQWWGGVLSFDGARRGFTLSSWSNRALSFRRES